MAFMCAGLGLLGATCRLILNRGLRLGELELDLFMNSELWPSPSVAVLDPGVSLRDLKVGFSFAAVQELWVTRLSEERCITSVHDTYTAPFQKFDPLSQTSYLAELGAERTTPPPRRLLTLSLGASAETK